MKIVRVTDPTTQPIDSATFMAHARISSLTTAETSLIDDIMIPAAVSKFEDLLGLSMVTQTWQMSLDYSEVPAGDTIMLPRYPAQSITSIISYDADNAATTMSTSDYWLDTASDREPRIVLNSGSTWPTDLRDRSALVIKWIAGYGDAATDVPARIRQALLQTLAAWWEYREATTDGMVYEIPPAALTAVETYRRFVI